jgi:hypothetical protein
MDRGEAARRRPRGGDGIQAPRSARTRLTAGAAALALAAGLGVWSTLAADREAWLPALLAAPGVALLAFALTTRHAGPVGWSIALLGAAYAAQLALGGASVDTRAPLQAAGLLLVAELAFDSLDGVVARAGPELAALRVGVLTGLVVGTIALGAGIIALAAIPLRAGVVLTAVGVAAAVVAFALLARLTRSHEQ